MSAIITNILFMHIYIGMASCGCGNCSIFTLCSNECQNPNHARRIPILCHSMPVLSQYQEREVVLILSLRSILQLLRKYCHLFLEADPGQLKFFLRNYYPEFRVMAVGRKLVEEFHSHIFWNVSWVSDANLTRFRDVANALNVEEAVKVVDTLESTLDLLIGERIIRTTETVHYPYNGGCTCKPHFLFVVDEDFQELPHSIFAALLTRVSDGIKQSKGVDPYVSFVAIQITGLHGFNVKSLS